MIPVPTVYESKQTTALVRTWRVNGKFPAPTGNQTPFIHSVASDYTECSYDVQSSNKKKNPRQKPFLCKSYGLRNLYKRKNVFVSMNGCRLGRKRKRNSVIIYIIRVLFSSSSGKNVTIFIGRISSNICSAFNMCNLLHQSKTRTLIHTQHVLIPHASENKQRLFP
jgi:hypothetical protein